MKKLMTFAIMALLMGGFAYNANAQEGVKKDQKHAKEELMAENWDQTLTEFEQLVDKCVNLYQKMQKDEAFAKENQADFQKTLKKAENLKAKIEKNKNKLDKKQGERYNTICKKMLKLYEK